MVLTQVSSLPPVAEGLRHQQPDTFMFVGLSQVGCKGTLYVTESFVCWWCEEQATGFVLDYPSMLIHAIARDTSAFPHPCIYAQIDTGEDDNEEEAEGDDEAEGEEEAEEKENSGPVSRPNELRFCPSDPSSLEVIFKALSECQTLHPDPEEEAEEMEDGSGDEGEDEEGAFDDAEEESVMEDGDGDEGGGEGVELHDSSLVVRGVGLTAQGLMTEQRLAEMLFVQQEQGNGGGEPSSSAGPFSGQGGEEEDLGGGAQ